MFTGNDIGDYSFCFNNEMSTVTDKFVDFEIAVRVPACRGVPQCIPLYCTAHANEQPLRSRTKPGSTCPPRREPLLNKRHPSKSPSSRSRVSCRPCHETKSISARARTATSALSGAPRRGSSTSAWSNVVLSSVWERSKSLSFGSSSREQGRAMYKLQAAE